MSSMDACQIKKIQALNRYKRRQFLDNLYMYFFTTLACSLICCFTLFLPYLSSTVRGLFLACIPCFISYSLSSKLLFIAGNFIIAILVVHSRIFYSNSVSTTDVYSEEYIRDSERPQCPNPLDQREGKKLEKHVIFEENVEMSGGLHGQGLEARRWVDPVSEVSKEDQEVDEEEVSLVSDTEELNRRAGDFIARFNEQRRLESTLLHCAT